MAQKLTQLMPQHLPLTDILREALLNTDKVPPEEFDRIDAKFNAREPLTLREIALFRNRPGLTPVQRSERKDWTFLMLYGHRPEADRRTLAQTAGIDYEEATRIHNEFFRQFDTMVKRAGELAAARMHIESTPPSTNSPLKQRGRK